MNSGEFGWETLLHTDAPLGCMLKGGLLTTYDRADERVLAEHLLPLLLRLGCEPEGEGRERQYFLLELDRRLKQLHDRLVVVSSTVREEDSDVEHGESNTYDWIWRSIRHVTVGRGGKAVQHAKLWMLHWGAAAEGSCEYLEIVVSSANLTRAAFRGQLQATWRALLELRPQRAEARLAKWGVLPAFLKELAASAGEGARFLPFVDLLARAEVPDGVTFVASVPGRHGRQVLQKTPWGAAGLATIAPPGRGKVKMSILSPFVGSWSNDALERWCARFSGAPDRVELVWIEKSHPWAVAGRWLLPKSTWLALTQARASLLRLRRDPDDRDESDLFHEEHRLADDRWSHAKIYALQRGTSRRVLVTSANFSPAAWGSESHDGELSIENFELGVCVEQGDWPFAELDEFGDPADAATAATPTRTFGRILWARAAWDGQWIKVECRCEGDRVLSGEIFAGGASTPIPTWVTGPDARLRSARVPWSDGTRPPAFAELNCDGQAVRVTVFDERPSQQREDTMPPEVDVDVVEAMRDDLLFEQYGGLVAADMAIESAKPGAENTDEDDEPGPSTAGIADPDTDPDAGSEEDGASGRQDSYAVPAFVLARRHLGVVDSWASHVQRAAKLEAGDFERQVLKRDGELLIEAFDRQAGRDEKKGPSSAIGARLAAEELTVRLKHLQGA